MEAAPVTLPRLPNDDILLIADMGRSAQGWLSYMLSYILNARYIEPYNLLHGVDYTLPTLWTNIKGDLPGRPRTRFALVVKTHEMPGRNVGLTHSMVYLTRDPRDIAVSMHYLHLKRWRDGDRSFSTFLHRFPQISCMMVARRWRPHFRAWREQSILHVRYEDLRHDTEGTLAKILTTFGVAVDHAIIGEAIDQFSFERSYGKKRGIEDVNNTHARKGIIGDYRNHLSPFWNRVFWLICGKEAELAGYRLDGSTTIEPTGN